MGTERVYCGRKNAVGEPGKAETVLLYVSKNGGGGGGGGCLRRREGTLSI